MSSMTDDGNALRSALEFPSHMTGFMSEGYVRIWECKILAYPGVLRRKSL